MLMNTFPKAIAVLLLSFFLSFSGVWFLLVFTGSGNEEIVTEEGFLIKDTTASLAFVEYRFERVKKTEEISQYWMFGPAWRVVYSGECERVLEFHDGKGKERKSVSAWSCAEETVNFSDGIVRKVISREDPKVRKMLEEGKRLRDEMRMQYSKYF